MTVNRSGPEVRKDRVSSLGPRLTFFLCSVLILLVTGTACGPANLGGPCNTTCDCKLTTAPVKCPGEWICNAQSTCEYTCKNTCQTGGVYTCSASDDCNGSICSSRLGCR
jgi:hypothetical protein